jgi:GNAT superfamily N-acetyltransferase
MWGARRRLRIRSAESGEAAALSALALESKAHWGYAADILARWQDELTISAGDVLLNHVYVAEIDGGPAGFYMLRSEGASWVIEHLWVRPNTMHRGIGSQLIRHALLTAVELGASRIRIVAEPNAAGFYEREGGVRTGSVRAPLPNDEGRELLIYEFRPGTS